MRNYITRAYHIENLLSIPRKLTSFESFILFHALGEDKVWHHPGKDKMVNGSIESLFKFWTELILTKKKKARKGILKIGNKIKIIQSFELLYKTYQSSNETQWKKKKNQLPRKTLMPQ